VKRVYVISDTLKTVYDTLNANGVQIPFPQRDIHIKTDNTPTVNLLNQS
jgi:small-conductance mechanosensitive channel